MLEIPGFVDLQVNGYLGVDFSDPTMTEEQFLYAARKLLDTGCAAFCRRSSRLRRKRIAGI